MGVAIFGEWDSPRVRVKGGSATICGTDENDIDIRVGPGKLREFAALCEAAADFMERRDATSEISAEVAYLAGSILVGDTVPLSYAKDILAKRVGAISGERLQSFGGALQDLIDRASGGSNAS